jgi:hypothetical protein
MAANTFNVTAIHDGYRIPLHGDMDVSLNDSVSNNFTIRFFCKTKEFFVLKTDRMILDLTGNRVTSTTIGGQIGLSYEMMYNTATNTWEFSDSNVVAPRLRKFFNRLPWESAIITPPVTTPVTPIPTAVVLTTPVSNVTTSSTISLTANVTGTSGVVKVEFYKGDTLISTDFTKPYTASIPVTSTDNGTLVFSTKVYNVASEIITSETKSVLINIEVPPPVVTDTEAPSIAIGASKTSVTAEESITLTAVVSDNVAVTKVDFYKNNVLFSSATASPWTASSMLSSGDNGTVVYTAKAYDAASNSKTSDAVNVAVAITPPAAVTTLTMSQSIVDSTTTARDAAPLGAKRVAVANAIVVAMQPSHSLNIYRNNVLVASATYDGDCVVSDDGVNVKVGMGFIATCAVYQNADISTGTWTFTVAGGTNSVNTIKGTVGPVNSNANLILSESLSTTLPFDADVSFSISRALDGFAA